MRIISGILKGRKILEPTDKHTRPLKDLTKESLFNLISHSKNFDFKMKSAKVLDIFCGTGAMGIEAISRGAIFCHFIDKSFISKQITLENINKFSCEKETQFSLKNVLDIGVCNHDKADVIFLDPPYKNNIAEASLQKLSEFGWIDKNTLIILEKGKDEIFGSGFRLIDSRIYGNTEILFLKF